MFILSSKIYIIQSWQIWSEIIYGNLFVSIKSVHTQTVNYFVLPVSTQYKLRVPNLKYITCEMLNSVVCLQPNYSPSIHQLTACYVRATLVHIY